MIKNRSNFASPIEKWPAFLALIPIVVSFLFQNAGAQNPVAWRYKGQLLPNIGAYQIFEGDPKQLKAGKGFIQYDLVSGSFTDFAEKKRFIKIPEGQTMVVSDDGLPIFPDGTVLTKTFYYFKDKRNPTLGIKLIETRVMLRSSGRWIAGTYLWNDSGTDANLSTGSDSKVTWIDEQGTQKSIRYHVPSAKQCMQCHQVAGQLVPIGPKIRNLNTNIIRNGTDINQLEHLRKAGIIDVDRNVLSSMVSTDNEQSIEHRATTYLDINCGHCHQKDGYCSKSELKLSSGSTDNAILAKKSTQIDRMMSTGRMPMIGTTVDTAGIAPIKQYLNTLK